MTREDVKAIMPDATDEQITAFLNAHHNEMNADPDEEVKRYKTLLSEAKKNLKASERAREQAESDLNQLKDEQLSDEDRLAKAIKDANDKESEYNVKLNRLEAEKVFVDAGISQELYNGFIDGIVTSDAEISKKMAESLANAMKSHKEAAETALREQLANGAPMPHGVDDGDGRGTDPKLSPAQQVAQKLAKANSANVKSAKDALSYYTGGSDESN